MNYLPVVELPTMNELIDQAKREAIRTRLEYLRWDLEKTHKSLGISRKCLWELRVKYGITR